MLACHRQYEAKVSSSVSIHGLGPLKELSLLVAIVGDSWWGVLLTSVCTIGHLLRRPGPIHETCGWR